MHRHTVGSKLVHFKASASLLRRLTPSDVLIVFRIKFFSEGRVVHFLNLIYLLSALIERYEHRLFVIVRSEWCVSLDDRVDRRLALGRVMDHVVDFQLIRAVSNVFSP